MLELYYKYEDEIQVGVDEAGRGSLIGPVFAAAVIWDGSKENNDIKDSKKISRKKRAVLRTYIEENAIAFGVGSASHEEIDELNILNATYLAMHRALDNLSHDFDRILVDGHKFKPYKCNAHTCIKGGDNKYVSIAAASILAKEYHDDWISQNYPDDDKYNLNNNKGYGTKMHMDALKKHGMTQHHRTTFCQKLI
jgi:ribonuclease HII